jgi:hypothetical protein
VTRPQAARRISAQCRFKRQPAIYVVFQRFSVLAGLGAVGCVLGNPFSYEYGWALPSPHPSLLFPSGRRSLP